MSALVKDGVNLRLVDIPVGTSDLKGLPLHEAKMHSIAYNLIASVQVQCIVAAL